MSGDFLILDRARDLDLFRRNGIDGVLVTISAEALAAVPLDWPPGRLITLDQILDQARIESAISEARSQLIDTCFADPCCPYYKIKQIIDVCLEKGVIVDALARLPGRKWFVAQRGAWIAVDADLSEDLRIPALLMEHRDGFAAATVERMHRLGFEARSFVRNAARALRSLTSGNPPAAPLLVDTSYGTAGDFSGVPARQGGIGALAHLCLRRLRFAEAWALLRFDRPVAAPAPSSSVELARRLTQGVLARSRAIHAIVAELARRENWFTAPYLFTVKHGGIIDYAAVRAARTVGVPVATMQHAVVGHDEWTASQYVDAFESDLKLVSSPIVARELAAFERGRCEYLATSIPHFRRRAHELEQWHSDALIYVLTGFTRTNTMYDNRRLNDAIYLAAVRRNLQSLKASFRVRLKPHPYNVSNFDMSIERRLSAEFGIGVGNAPLHELDGAVVIDSPTTILGDAVRLGKWVFVINETAVLREPFASRAADFGVLHASAAALAQAVTARDRSALRKGQEAFREFFLSTYLTAPERRLPDAIAAWLAGHRAIDATRSNGAASRPPTAHPPRRDGRVPRA